MAFDEIYAERVRNMLVEVPTVLEKKMFGSLGFMINGHLAIGVGDGSDGSILMVRVGKHAEDDALERPGASTTIMRGRPMHGWIDLTPAAVKADNALREWIALALSYVQSLPPKKK